jgi:SAM-dependent methyltransferase
MDTRDPHIHATREFFTPRAATWDEKFPDDDPAFADAVSQLALRPGGTALDVGCGTGRALPHLRAAVGAAGTVAGIDLTPAMAAIASERGPAAIGDARRLPFPDATADAVLAAGLITHPPEPMAGLAELARVTRPGGRLALFQPIGRAALAARRGHALRPDDIRDPANPPRRPARDRLDRARHPRRPRPLPRPRPPRPVTPLVTGPLARRSTTRRSPGVRPRP